MSSGFTFGAKFQNGRRRRSFIDFFIKSIGTKQEMTAYTPFHTQSVNSSKKKAFNCFVVMVMSVISCSGTTIIRSPQSCRRLGRNTGWWGNVWGTYSASRFKKTFRVSRTTFIYILNRIKGQLERKTLAEDPIAPERRLALCLYRLGRGDYYYTIAEMVGLGVSTICSIVQEVCRALVENLWTDTISALMPKSEEEFREKILDMEEMWQFPCCLSAIDGCHIPIKCPPGGQEASKEYHNFKNCGFDVFSRFTLQIYLGQLWIPRELARLYNISVN